MLPGTLYELLVEERRRELDRIDFRKIDEARRLRRPGAVRRTLAAALMRSARALDGSAAHFEDARGRRTVRARYR
jgi:hypothetical protein